MLHPFTYTFFGARKFRIINNNKVKVVGPGPPWCLAPCRPGLNQFKDQGYKCAGSGLAWMRSGIKKINYANSGLAWVSCEHVGQALGLRGAWHPSGLAWKKYLIKRINSRVRSGARKEIALTKKVVGMEVMKSYVCPKFPKSAWSAVEIVVAVVPVCSRLVVAMCMCTRRVR